MIKEIVDVFFRIMLLVIVFICLLIMGIISADIDYKNKYEPYDPEVYKKNCEEGSVSDCYLFLKSRLFQIK